MVYGSFCGQYTFRGPKQKCTGGVVGARRPGSSCIAPPRRHLEVACGSSTERLGLLPSSPAHHSKGNQSHATPPQSVPLPPGPPRTSPAPSRYPLAPYTRPEQSCEGPRASYQTRLSARPTKSIPICIAV